MALVGGWLVRSTRSSGEEAVRTRLESSLASAAQTIGYRWIDRRSALHQLAEHERVRAAVRDGSSAAIPADDPVWARLGGFVESATVRSSDARFVVPAILPLGELSPDPLAATLLVSVPVHESALGPRVGTLDAKIRLSHLLPPSLWSAGVGGGMVALFDAANEPLLPSPLDLDLLRSQRFSWNGEQWITVRQQLFEPPLQIAVAAPLGPVAEPITQAAERGMIALVIVSLLALLAAALVSARLTRSLEDLASAADAVSLGRLDAGVSEVGSVEVRKVSRAFNAMVEHVRVLLRTVAQQRAAAAVGEFAASLAHEIRNPLTAVRLEIEDARDRLADPSTAALLDHALAEIDRLDSTVRGTLRIAASGTIDLAPMDLSDPARVAIRAAQPRSQEAGASIESALCGSPTPVRGNAAAIEQLVLNLVLNAIDAAGDGGHVRVTVESSDGRAWVAVDDDGPGIPQTDLARVEDPFFTTKPGGTGLGLSVARRIADAHGGELRLEALASGGTRACFVLALLDRNEMEPPSVPKR